MMTTMRMKSPIVDLMEFRRPFEGRAQLIACKEPATYTPIFLYNQREVFSLQAACVQRCFAELQHIDFKSLGFLFGFGSSLLAPNANGGYDIWNISPRFGYPGLPLLVDNRTAKQPATGIYHHFQTDFTGTTLCYHTRINNAPISEVLVAKEVPSIVLVTELPSLFKLQCGSIPLGAQCSSLRLSRQANSARARALNSFIAYRCTTPRKEIVF
jgi:hypothetical protein